MKRLCVVLRTIMLRRTKDAEYNGKKLLQLPKRNVDVVMLDFASEEERAFYRKIELRIKDSLSDEADGKHDMMGMLVMLLRLRQGRWCTDAAVVHALRARKEAPERLLCLGIGKLDTSAAQFQLAMVLAFRARLEVRPVLTQQHPPGLCAVTIYDPLFDAQDCALVVRLGMTLPAQNKVRVRLTSAGNIPWTARRSCTCRNAPVRCTRRCCVPTGMRCGCAGWCCAATTWMHTWRRTRILR